MEIYVSAWQSTRRRSFRGAEFSSLFSIISFPGARAVWKAPFLLHAIGAHTFCKFHAPNGNFIPSEGAFRVRRAQIRRQVVITCKSFRHNKGVQNISKKKAHCLVVRPRVLPEGKKMRGACIPEPQDGGERSDKWIIHSFRPRSCFRIPSFAFQLTEKHSVPKCPCPANRVQNSSPLGTRKVFGSSFDHNEIFKSFLLTLNAAQAVWHRVRAFVAR